MSEDDRPIQRGDLVMVVKACCTARVRPLIFEVADFLPSQLPEPEYIIWISCMCCGQRMPNTTFAHSGRHEDYAQPLPWLKRIPPLTDDEKKREELNLCDDALRHIWRQLEDAT